MDRRQTPRVQELPQMSGNMMTSPSSVDGSGPVASMRNFSAPSPPLQQSTEGQSSWTKSTVNPGTILPPGYYYAEDTTAASSNDQVHSNQGEQDSYLDPRGSQSSTSYPSPALYTSSNIVKYDAYGATQNLGGQSQIASLPSSSNEGFRYTVKDFAKPEDLQSLAPGSKRKLSRDEQFLDTRFEEDPLLHGFQGQPEKRRRVETSNTSSPIVNDDRTPAPERKRKESKLAAKDARLPRPAGKNHQAIGEVTTGEDGVLMWYEKVTKTWLKAAYHEGYRREFIETDATLGSYDETPECGLPEDTYNVTSYCDLMQRWTSAKESVCDSQGRKVLCMLDKPDDWKHNPDPGVMMYKGLVMLDSDNNAVRDFAGAPRTLSSAISGMRLEGLRRVLGWTVADMMARMPSHRLKKSGVKPLQEQQLFTNEMLKFRKRENVNTWIDRGGSQVIKRDTLDRLRAQNPAATSTESLQPRTKAELKALDDLNKGKFGYRSRYVQENGETSCTGGKPKTLANISSENDPRIPIDQSLHQMASTSNLVPAKYLFRNGPGDNDFANQAERGQPEGQGSSTQWQREFLQQGAHSNSFNQALDVNYTKDPREITPQSRGVYRAPTSALPPPTAEPARPSQKRKREGYPIEIDPSPLLKRQDRGQSKDPEGPFQEGGLVSTTEEANNPPPSLHEIPREGYLAGAGNENKGNYDIQRLMDDAPIDFQNITAEELDDIFAPLFNDENLGEPHASEDQETGGRDRPSNDAPNAGDVSEDHSTNELSSRSPDGQVLRETDDEIRLTSQETPTLESAQIGQEENSSDHQSTLDFRVIAPRNENEERIIQQSLSATLADYRIRTGSYPTSTPRHESYSVQVDKILDEFTDYWNNLNHSPESRMPELAASIDDWEGGFEGWVPAPSGDILESLVKAIEQGANGQRGGELSYWRALFQLH